MTQLTDETKQDLIDSINRINDTRLTPEMLLFSEASASDGPLNTEFTASVIGGQGYEGKQTFYYHRLDLADLYNVIVTSLKARPIATTYDILPDINRICKLELAEADIVNETLNLQGTPGETFTLRASPSSNRYTGELTFTLTYTSSYLIRGRFRHTAGRTYQAMLAGNIDGFNHRLFTLYINGVLHPIQADGTYTSALPSGVYEFSLNTPMPRGFCTQNPIIHVSNMVDFSGKGDFAHCFDGSRTLETIGDDIFTGNLDILTLSGTFANCNNLVSVGRNILANLDGYRALDNLFYNCPKLETIGETEAYSRWGGQTDITYSLYNCRKLQKVPDNWLRHSQYIRDASFTFTYVGFDTEYGCELPQGLFDGFEYLAFVQSTFSYAKIKRWPTAIFSQLLVVRYAKACFKGSNFDRFEPDMFGLFNGSLDAYEAFSSLTVPVSLPGYLMGRRGPITAAYLFAHTTFTAIDPDVLKNGYFTNLERMFEGATLPRDGMPNIFNEQYWLTSLAGVFADAHLTLTEKNRTLFSAQNKVTTINTLFQKTHFYGGVFPPALFSTMPLITDIGASFTECEGVDATLVIPDGLFSNQSRATNFIRVFSEARNIRFEGTVFPTARTVTNLNRFFGNNPSEIGYTAEFGRYTDNVTDASLLFAFANTTTSTYPDGLLDHFTSCTIMDETFRGSNYTELPSDMFKNCHAVTSMLGIFQRMSNLTVPAGLLDPVTELTNARSMFEEVSRLTVPDYLFEKNLKIRNLTGLFSRCSLNRMPNMLLGSNPATPSMAMMFMNGRITSEGIVENRLGVPIVGSLLWFMWYCVQNDNGDPITVKQFLDYVGFGPLGHLSDDPEQWTEMFYGCSALTGSKQALYLGLWQVDNLKQLPAKAPGDIARNSSNLY